MSKMNPDKQWAYYNEEVIKYTKAQEFYRLGQLYYEMADFLKNEGKDNKKVKKLGYDILLQLQKDSLTNYKESGSVEKVEVIAVPESSCSDCLQLDGKIFTLKEAMKTNPIPVEDCENKFGCRCVYAPHFD